MDIQEVRVNPEVKNYRGRSKILLWLCVLIVAAASYKMGYQQGRAGLVFEPKSFKVINQTEAPGTVDYNLLWQAISKLKTNHIDKPSNDQKILYGAAKGAVASVGDPYTEFFTPEELKDFQTDLAGSFDGIGAEIGKRDGNLVVIAPLEGSPAKAAGLVAKDIILKVNDETVGDWSVEEAIRKIRGPKGSEVRLTVFREDAAQPLEIRIIRAEIEIKSVKWELKQIGEKQVGLISLLRFGDDTAELFAQAVQAMQAAKVSALVLDLRNDPGGYLDKAVEIAGYWLPKGDLVVSEVFSSGEVTKHESAGAAVFSSMKTLVLVNEGSASASEILAGALRDHDKARLLGEKTFGKGSVQQVQELPEGAALKVTIAKWVTPGGRNLNKDGLAPDVAVKFNQEEARSGKDSQLEAALAEAVK